ncbi:class I SAM-dependent methyltransferase [Myxococcaceae bacterium GXIMD 01537]
MPLLSSDSLLSRRLRLYGQDPGKVFHRLRYWVWERMHPDEPWLTPGAVDFLATWLRPDMTGIEWGSGRSTRWYAKHLNHLLSVEHHEGWYARVKAELDGGGVRNVDYRNIPLSHPESEGTRPHYEPLPPYVGVVREFPEGTLDFAVVDGHYRQACVREALPRLKPGGLLLVDDTTMIDPLSEWGVPADWPVASHTSNGLKTTTLWRKPPAR